MTTRYNTVPNKAMLSMATDVRTATGSSGVVRRKSVHNVFSKQQSFQKPEVTGKKRRLPEGYDSVLSEAEEIGMSFGD